MGSMLRIPDIDYLPDSGLSPGFQIDCRLPPNDECTISLYIMPHETVVLKSMTNVLYAFILCYMKPSFLSIDDECPVSLYGMLHETVV